MCASLEGEPEDNHRQEESFVQDCYLERNLPLTEQEKVGKEGSEGEMEDKEGMVVLGYKVDSYRTEGFQGVLRDRSIWAVW